MDDLRKIQLYILDKVTELLEQNKFDYWLDSGTLLGARRHQGFIPWDDDIDIAVHMNDYIKIVNLLVEKLPNDLKIEDNGLKAMNSEGSPIKIFYVHSLIEDSINQKESQIFIDLFVYSPINPNFIKSIRSKLLKYFIVAKSEKLNINFKGLKKYVYILLNLILSKKIVNALVGRVRKSQLNSDYLGYDYLCWPTSKYHHKNEIFPLRKMIFEGKYYNVPNNVDLFLSRQYGNSFMELPPLEERKGHHVARYEITKFPNEE